VPGIIDLETADLNADGRLDLIACSYMDPVTGHHDTGALLLWGGRDGFSQWNAQRLPAITPLAPVVADLDGDGWLDIFFPNYHDELHREQVPSYLYWGAPEGFSPRRRTALVNDSAADGLAADFDGDGKLDLAVVNHSVDGAHHAFSKVYFNDGNRFADPRVRELPTHGPHWMWDEDLGHIADRGYRQRYGSSVFAWKHGAAGGAIEVAARIPDGAGLVCEVRSARTEAGLAAAGWRPVESGRFALDRGDRYLQYNLILAAKNGDSFPVVDRVMVRLRRETR
jgi:FG-GAP-like repeat